MRFRPPLPSLLSRPDPHLQINPNFSHMAASLPRSVSPEAEEVVDERPCEASCSLDESISLPLTPVVPLLESERLLERAWEHWRRIGSPRLIVAPMVDNSELPFRMLCRKYGAEAAYTPMLHSRIFTENEKYRGMEFTTCTPAVMGRSKNKGKETLNLLPQSDPAQDVVEDNSSDEGDMDPGGGGGTPFVRASSGDPAGEKLDYNNDLIQTIKEDRPLFVQFCANDPDVLLEAAKKVEPYCDYIDINFGCPQRIARRGNYGAFLMDNLPLIKALVEKLARNLQVPVSCKIRVFPDLKDTLAYAKMLQEAGCALLAVHGRTRDEKDSKIFRADWDAIKEVKNALKIPVLANGNIRHMDDIDSCLMHTKADGVLSAESLLENPALFSGLRTAQWKDEDANSESGLDQADLVEEYLKFCERYPVPMRMVRSHVHKMLGEWFRVQPCVREELNAQSKLTFGWLFEMVNRLRKLNCRIPLYAKGGGDDDSDKILDYDS